MAVTKIMVHPTAEVSPLAQMGQEPPIWHYPQVRKGRRTGCIITIDIYVGFGVTIKSNGKNGVSMLCPPT